MPQDDQGSYMQITGKEGTSTSSFLVLDPAGNIENFTSEMSQTKLKVMLSIPTV